MFDSIKQWWTRKERLITQLQNEINVYKTDLECHKSANKELAAHISQANIEITELRTEIAESTRRIAAIENFRRDRYNGTTPWFEVTSAEYDEVKGLQVTMDWNDAFVEHLKQSGFTGPDNESIIQKWLTLLSKDISERLEQQSIDSTLGPRESPFI